MLQLKHAALSNSMELQGRAMEFAARADVADRWEEFILQVLKG
jgi:hypothetical protein